MLETRLDEMRCHLEVFSTERDQLRDTNARLVEKHDDAPREILFKQALVSETKSHAQDPHVPAGEHADVFREQDKFKVLLQSVPVQVQGL